MIDNQKLEADRELLREAQSQGTGATLKAYVKLSGPGWLQSAITLGGGSLASSLYLGVLAGFAMLWLQPLAMILGIIMLSAIGYITMSTGERPLRAINEHINPVLGWSWALASLVSSMVWCLPQYSLANAVLQQNLLPGLVGGNSGLGEFGGKLLICALILLATTAITWSYDTGKKGVRIYEIVLKIMVGVIVLSFIGVVVSLALSSASLDWGAIFSGFVPDFSKLYEPANDFKPLLDNIPEEHRAFWTGQIVDRQRDVMISAAATAVGINMTFLFPYTLLRRGWTKEFRGLAVFDLCTGMFIPFVLATSCVIIAASSQFHARPVTGFNGEKDDNGQVIKPSERLQKEYRKVMEERLQYRSEEKSKLSDKDIDEGAASLNPHERKLAATLLNRDAFNLAQSLEPLTGRFFADVVFGIRLLGISISTITLLMLISGFVVCEMLGVAPTGWPFRLGSLAAATGILGPFIWGGPNAQFYLAVPASIFGMTLLPIAYLTFFFLMNQKGLLREDLPRGGRRLLWNGLMAVAAGVATFASVWVIWQKAGYYGIGAVVALFVLALVVHFQRKKPTPNG